MNLIFLTLAHIGDINQGGIYCNLMRKFRDEGHGVYIVTPCERRIGLRTSLVESNGVHILNVKTLNIQKSNIVEKGIGTLLLERQFQSAIKKYLNGVSFDLITYSTPPVTFTNVVNYLKKQNPSAISYLQLKDIFPQNAVDIGIFSKGSILYKYFRKKEMDLYRASDYIGCMSPANVKYVLDHNDFVSPEKVEVAPNSIDLNHTDSTHNTDKDAIRIKYGIPTDKPIFIYGGNLGKPQGINYLIKCLDANKDRQNCYFVVIGTGTEFPKLKAWYEEYKPTAVKVMAGLPKEDYDKLVKVCDVGLIFLDYRFTIPNYPSRLLSYLENKMPVICATDVNTDIGKIAEQNGFGYWCESVRTVDFTLLVNKILSKPGRILEMGEKGYQFLCDNYQVEHSYQAIIKHLQKNIVNAVKTKQ